MKYNILMPFLHCAISRLADLPCGDSWSIPIESSKRISNISRSKPRCSARRLHQVHHDPIIVIIHLRCPWDPRFRGFFFFETTVSLPVRLLGDYIKDIKSLALARPYGFCGISLYGGFYFRFVKKSRYCI